MRNVFEMPVMSISVFDVEDIITTSLTGQSVDETSIINNSEYAKVTARWDTANNVLSFTNTTN